MKKEKTITFVIPAEDAEYVEAVRIYNVKIPISYIFDRLKDEIIGEKRIKNNPLLTN